MILHFLGTGTSYGVPVVGCECKVCTSNNPKNIRFRSSLLIKYNGLDIVIDTPQEFRLQMLRANINKLDVVLLTHFHADHVLGLDDTRIFVNRTKQPIIVYSTQEVIKKIKDTFVYMFERPWIDYGLPRLDLRPIENGVEIEDIKFIPVPVKHGEEMITGFRFGKCAYITDCSFFPESSLSLLENLDILILNALRHKPHPTHFCLSESIELAKKVGAKVTYFTHISHDIDYDEVSRILPPNIFLAYDGLEVKIE